MSKIRHFKLRGGGGGVYVLGVYVLGVYVWRVCVLGGICPRGYMSRG